MPTSGPSLETLKQKALDTAQRFIDYDSYGTIRAKALAALRPKAPGHSRDEYEHWFDLAVRTHKDAIHYLKDQSKRIAELYLRNKSEFSLEGEVDDFLEAHREFSSEQLLGVLVFAYYLYHLR